MLVSCTSYHRPTSDQLPTHQLPTSCLASAYQKPTSFPATAGELPTNLLPTFFTRVLLTRYPLTTCLPTC